jgi:MFS family permease
VMGALASARREKPRAMLLLASALLLAFLFTGAALMPTYLTFGLALVALGWSVQTFMTTANSTVQLWTDPAMRGRVMALYMAVFMGGTPIGAPLVGALAEAFGARWSLLAGGLVSATAAGVCAVLLARRRGIEIRGELREMSRQRVGADSVVESVR